MATFPGSAPSTVVTYNALTGGLESPPGTGITGATSYTLAQFLVLTIANYIGYTINISDIPTAHSSSNGVYVRANDAGTGWIFLQIPSFTTANLPTIAQASGWGRIFHSQLGMNGGYIYSDGTRFRIDSPVVLSNIIEDLTLSAMPTAATVVKQVGIPFLGGKSLWGVGDILQIHTVPEKTGTADTMTTGVFIGANALAINAADTNTSITTYSTGAGSGAVVPTERRIVRKADAASVSVLRLMGANGVPGTGGAATAKAVDISLAVSLDSVATYVDSTLHVGASTTDTALKLVAHTITLIPAGAA